MNGNERQAAEADLRRAERKLTAARENAAGVHGFAATLTAPAAVKFWTAEVAAARARLAE